MDLLGGGAAGGRQRRHSVLPSNVMQAVIGVKFIADHVKQQDDEKMVNIRLFYTEMLNEAEILRPRPRPSQSYKAEVEAEA